MMRVQAEASVVIVLSWIMMAMSPTAARGQMDGIAGALKDGVVQGAKDSATKQVEDAMGVDPVAGARTTGQVPSANGIAADAAREGTGTAIDKGLNQLGSGEPSGEER